MTFAADIAPQAADLAPPARGERAPLRPTLRAVLVFTATIPLAILVIAGNRALWPLSFTGGLLALALIGADALLILRRQALRVVVAAPPRLPVGETGQVRVDISTEPVGRDTPLTIVLEQTGEAELPVIARATTRDGRVSVGLPLTGLRRGRLTIDALWLRWAGPLGLVERRWRMALDRGVDVIPVIRGLRGAALDVAMDARFGAKVQRDRGEGAEFETLREHVAGLDNRHIDWKRSARHTKLVSKVFRTERNHQIVLAFDTGHLMLEPIDGKTRLDHAIEAGLTLGWISLKSDDLVGAYAFDAAVRHYLAPGAGLAMLSRIQAAVARLDYTTEETNFTLALAALDQRLKRRALVVLFTEFVDTITAELLLESIQRVARRHVLIFVTLRDPQMTRIADAEPSAFMPVARSVIAHDLMRDRAIVLERLARLGVHVIDADAGKLTSGLVNTYLRVKQRGEL